MNDFQKTAKEMLDFIEKSPTCFHAVVNIGAMLEEAGYVRLRENEEWKLVKGGKYYTERNDSSVIAFAIPTETVKGFHMAAAHSDSPCFKVKEKPELTVEDHYMRLNTEKYGGMILSTWMDRPLSVAGRLAVRGTDGIQSRLVNIDRDLCVIPNVAIHMNREMNKGVEYNPQVDMLPLFADVAFDTDAAGTAETADGPQEKPALLGLAAEAAGVDAEAILGEDLFLYIRQEGRFLGIIGVSDTVKATSYEAINAWEKMGVRVIMLTGDNRRTAEAVRQKLGISEVVAEVLPQDKEKKVSELKAQGHKVAMIGDGINDAPALAAADVGMAIGAGTDVAMESADIILMKNDLRDAVTAMKLSRAVIRNIKENLFWAFFYNCIGIPLAAGVLYPAFQIRLNPMFGAAAMSLSSIFVVGNALRLRGFKSGFTPLKKEAPEVTRKEIEITHAAAEGEQCILKTPAEQNNRQDVKQEKERTNTMTKVISIEGMMCNHCTGTVQKALEAVEGVKAVTMSLEQKNATVELASDVADEVLTKAVVDAGYEVKGVTAK